MTVRLKKIVTFLIPDENESFSWWVEYEWDNDSQVWFRSNNNSGFMFKFEFPETMTEQTMLAYMMKYS